MLIQITSFYDAWPAGKKNRKDYRNYQVKFSGPGREKKVVVVAGRGDVMI